VTANRYGVGLATQESRSERYWCATIMGKLFTPSPLSPSSIVWYQYKNCNITVEEVWSTVYTLGVNSLPPQDEINEIKRCNGRPIYSVVVLETMVLVSSGLEAKSAGLGLGLELSGLGLGLGLGLDYRSWSWS